MMPITLCYQRSLYDKSYKTNTGQVIIAQQEILKRPVKSVIKCKKTKFKMISVVLDYDLASNTMFKLITNKFVTFTFAFFVISHKQALN